MLANGIRAIALVITLAAAAAGSPARAAVGGLVWERAAPVGATGFGSRLADAGDVDGDGKEDVLVAAEVLPYGTVFVLSGADGSTLRTFIGNLPHASPALLQEVRSAGDFDHDDVPDFLLGARASSDLASGEAGYIAVVSGRSSCDGLVLSADCEEPANG